MARKEKRPASGGAAIRQGRRRMPAEWEPHGATWIAWPHFESDWPGKMAAIPWVYAEIARVLHRHERVEILCNDQQVMDSARRHLDAHAVNSSRYRLHLVRTDRAWVRDSAPTFILNEAGRVELLNWAFNAWARYDNYGNDLLVGQAMERITGLPRREPLRPDTGERVVLEGGAIDTDGAGMLLVTEECLLSRVQERNPGLDRDGYERIFGEWLGTTKTIWLGEGCEGDDTHGHIDDVARFLAPGVVALCYEEDPADPNFERSEDNLRRLQHAGAKDGDILVVTLPYPHPIIMDGERLPASYANFYIANDVVLVPTFNDPNDRVALNTLAEAFPDREVVGIHAVDLVWGLGTLHCLTQQEPRGI